MTKFLSTLHCHTIKDIYEGEIVLVYLYFFTRSAIKCYRLYEKIRVLAN